MTGLLSITGASSLATASDQGAVVRHVQTNPATYRVDFAAWLGDNWPLWLRFCTYADRMRRRRANYSADAILHAIRFESDLADADPTYKVNNNWSADLGRLYNTVSGTEFFRLRERAA